MKKLSILFLISFACFYSLKAQLNCNSVINQNFTHYPINGSPYIVAYRDTLKCDIKTPEGNTVVTWAMEESSLLIRGEFDYAYILSPTAPWKNAEIIKTYDNLSSTRRFNCHGYAWLRVEQGIDRWIGYDPTYDGIYDPEKAYMKDGSYTKVSQHVYPGKVYWGGTGEDHSAITTSHPDTVISKWNEGPLAKHYWSYNPFMGSSKLEYYIRTPDISGPSKFCSWATYSIDNFPQGASVSWSAPGLSLQTSGNTATVTANTSGTYTISATISLNGNTIPLSKQILVPGYPLIDFLSSNNLDYNGDCDYYDVLRNFDNSQYWGSLTVSTGAGVNLQWSKFSCSAGFEWDYGNYLNNLSTVNVYSKKTGYIVLECAATNGCGITSNKNYYFSAGPSPFFFLVYPNPANDSFTVELVANETDFLHIRTRTAEPSYTIQVRHELLGLVRSEESAEFVKHVSLSGLPAGMYYVHIIMNGKTIDKQVLWKK